MPARCLLALTNCLWWCHFVVESRRFIHGTVNESKIAGYIFISSLDILFLAIKFLKKNIDWSILEKNCYRILQNILNKHLYGWLKKKIMWNLNTFAKSLNTMYVNCLPLVWVYYHYRIHNHFGNLKIGCNTFWNVFLVVHCLF